MLAALVAPNVFQHVREHDRIRGREGSFQVVRAAVEASREAGIYTALSGNAESKADSAQSTATTANSTANTALSNASAANTNANGRISKTQTYIGLSGENVTTINTSGITIQTSASGARTYMDANGIRCYNGSATVESKSRKVRNCGPNLTT